MFFSKFIQGGQSKMHGQDLPKLKLENRQGIAARQLRMNSTCPLKVAQKARHVSLKSLRPRLSESPSKLNLAQQVSEIEASLNRSLIEPSCLTKQVFAVYQQAFHKLLAQSQLPQILHSILTVYDRWVSLKEEELCQTQQELAAALDQLKNARHQTKTIRTQLEQCSTSLASAKSALEQKDLAIQTLEQQRQRLYATAAHRIQTKSILLEQMKKACMKYQVELAALQKMHATPPKTDTNKDSFDLQEFTNLPQAEFEAISPILPEQAESEVW